MLTPGVSAGTTNIEEPWYGWTSGLVTAMTTRMSATEPLVVYHLWPLMIHSPPSLTARVLSSRGSLPGRLRFGHREARADRAVEQRLEPALADVLLVRPVISMPAASSSALPLSGALLPKTTGP